MPSFVVLPASSRYKDTPVFDEGGALEFALWETPPEFVDLPQGSLLHLVRSNEVGFLDAIAVLYYGRGFEQLWPAIAAANGIIDPELEMFPGMQLVIPPRVQVNVFLSRRGDAV